MKKLNKRKIRWICREIRKGDISLYQIAKQQKISKVHAWRIFQKYNEVKNPLLSKPGRKPKPIPEEEIHMVLKIHKKYPLGAVKIEGYLRECGMKHIPHNKIHRILKLNGKVKMSNTKIRRKKWVRYERRHSNSLWHTDYCEIEGKQLIAYIDDASRYIVGYGMFGEATTENALSVLDNAVQKNGYPKQVMTDHGVQFCSNEEREFRFRNMLKSKGIQHIMARIKRPQSNGKIERWFGTFKKLYHHFNGNVDKAVACYNRMPHLSLDCSPAEAYLNKKRNC